MLKDELNKNPFTVPDNYFDRLPMEVQQRYEAKKSTSGMWATAIKPRLAYVAGIGALVLLSYSGVWFLSKNNSKPQNAMVDRTKQVMPNSFINNNAKSYAQFTNNDSNPLIHIVNDKDEQNNLKTGVNEAVIDYLAVENVSVDDILGF